MKKFSVPDSLLEAAKLVSETKKCVPKKRKSAIGVFINRKTPSQHQPNINPTPSQHHPNINPTPSQHHPNTVSTPFQHHPNTVSTPFQHQPNTVSTSSQHQPNTVSTSTQHQPNINPTPQQITLSNKQYMVYKYLKLLGMKNITNKAMVSRKTGVAYGTIRDIFRKFSIIGLITTKFDKVGKFYEYSINPLIQIKNEILELSNIDVNPTPFQHHSNIVSTSSQHQKKLIKQCWNGVGNTYSSSSSFNNIQDKLLLFKYDLIYWKQKGLTKKQMDEWMNLANCNEEVILRYLSYCRFEMVDLGVEESKPVENVLNWFYKILERTGGYPKPKGYKSFEEKRLDAEREELAKQERIAKERKEIYERSIKVKCDAEFYDMMNNPDSKMHLRCFEKLNKFTKKRKGTKAFEMGMRSAYDEIREE